MLTDDTFRQLVRDRRDDLEREAEAERLALRARVVRGLTAERPAPTELLGHLLAARRHALR